MLSIMGLYNYDPTIFELLSLPEELDKAECINSILINNAELSLLYTDPKIMKVLIGNWSKSSEYAWNKMAATLTLDYNPIWNKDGTITETEIVEGSGEGVQQVSGFDSDSFQNRGKDTAESSSSRTFTRVEQGNIGVTSSQQLIREEREIAAYNIYDEIAADFKNRFCIMVY